MRCKGAIVLMTALKRYGSGQSRDATVTKEACGALRSVTLGDDRRKDFSGAACTAVDWFLFRLLQTTQSCATPAALIFLLVSSIGWTVFLPHFNVTGGLELCQCRDLWWVVVSNDIIRSRIRLGSAWRSPQRYGDTIHTFVGRVRLRQDPLSPLSLSPVRYRPPELDLVLLLPHVHVYPARRDIRQCQSSCLRRSHTVAAGLGESFQGGRGHGVVGVPSP